MSNKIFIQIASYRDPELIPTIKDCISKAKHPENLIFAIAWQHDSQESLEQFKNDARFKIIDIPYQQSKGACWARNKIQQLYCGEEYTLQLDSHHRFIPYWDEVLINMLKSLKKKGHQKPLITSYLPSYDPENDPVSRIQVPWKMNFDRFIPEGAVFFLPGAMTAAEQLSPIPARFYSAHFAFADGCFCKEVSHDPEYYFHGEEISIAVRAYTWGYDLFHPNVTIAWHEYTRKNRTKQWDDDKSWYIKNASSHLRNRKLFGMDNERQDIDFGIYGFGSIRTLRDYEKYSGIQFKTRSVQQYTLNHLPPPNPLLRTEEEFESSFLKIFKHCINVPSNKIPETDCDFWCVSFHDKDGNVLHRKDATAAEIRSMQIGSDEHYKIWREFQTSNKPAKWIVWPHSASKGWGTVIEGVIE